MRRQSSSNPRYTWWPPTPSPLVVPNTSHPNTHHPHIEYHLIYLHSTNFVHFTALAQAQQPLSSSSCSLFTLPYLTLPYFASIASLRFLCHFRLRLPYQKNVCVYTQTYTHTHTHTDTPSKRALHQYTENVWYHLLGPSPTAIPAHTHTHTNIRFRLAPSIYTYIY